MTIKVLHVMSSLGGGGVERMVQNYGLALESHPITFDAAVHGLDKGELEDGFRSRGGEVFHLTPKRVSLWKNAKELYSVISAGRYDVVHAHQNLSNVLPLCIAKFCRVPVRISHGHGFVKAPKTYLSIVRVLLRIVGNAYFACTDEVGQWLHGRAWELAGNRCYVMKNALDMGDFRFNVASRQRIRCELGAERRTVLLQVGRLAAEKNHLFTLRVVAALHGMKIPCMLVIVGSGAMAPVIKDRAELLGIGHLVEFLGFRDDVGALMCGADLLLVPSIREGLGLVAIEAQVLGLPVVASTGLPVDVEVTSLLNRYPLHDFAKWVAAAADPQPFRFHPNDDAFILQGYEIARAAESYVKFIRTSLSGDRGASAC